MTIEEAKIEELEKLKLEMSPDSDDVWRVWNRTAVKIIDRHIADLKGKTMKKENCK